MNNFDHFDTQAALIGGLLNTGSMPDGTQHIQKLLLSNSDIRLDVDCFTLPAYRRAFELIIDLVVDDNPIDIVILTAFLDSEYLDTIDEAVKENISIANFDSYAKILIEDKRKRAKSELLNRVKSIDSLDEIASIHLEYDALRFDEKNESGFVDLANLCEKPRPENWLIKSYLTLDSLSLIFGDSGSGKSFIAIDLAGHIATGLDWCGNPVNPGKVLYIAGEGINGIAKRFKAWFERHNEAMQNIKIRTTPIALTEHDMIDRLIYSIKREMAEKPALIVIDTLNRNFGPGNENDTNDMGRAIAAIDKLRIATGAAILIIHHSGISDKGRSRGNSSLKGAVDYEYIVEKDDDAVELKCTKSKDSEPPPPLAWTLQKQFLSWADDDGTPIDSAVLEPSEAIEAKPEPDSTRLGSNQSKAIELLHRLYRTQQKNLIESGNQSNTARVTRSDWYAAMKESGFSSNRRTDVKRELIKRRLIREEDLFVYLIEADS